MAFAINTYTGNGSLTSFSVSFPYIEQAHVIVTVDGVTKTSGSDYSFSNTSTIAFGSAPANGAIIKFTRSTNRNARLVDYQDGSTITEAILDQDGNQSFFMAQEAIDITENSLNLNANDLWDANNKRIINVATPTGTNDSVNKAYVDAVAGSAAAAATSEANALSYKNAAETAKNAAEAALDTFDDDFLGAKSSDPSVDNDGNSLADGTLYYNTSDNRMKVYDLGTTSWLYIAPTSSDQTKINTAADNITAITNVNNNLTSINNFSDVYRISASAPTTHLHDGDMWFDTNADKLKIWNGSSWDLAGSSVNGTAQRYKFVATANQTTFTGTDANGNTLTYDSGYIDLYLNGVHLDPSDYTATDGSNIVMGSAVALNDEIYVVAFGTFSVSSIAGSAIDSGTINDARLPTTISDKIITATSLTAKGDGSSADGKITLNCSQNSHGVKIQSPAHSAAQSYTLILPTSVGTANQVLATNGNATNQLSWVDAQETKPTITSSNFYISPSISQTFTINGTNFVQFPKVEFISSTGVFTPATAVSYTSATALSVTVTLGSGAYRVKITNPDGNAGISGSAICNASASPTWSTAQALGSFAGNFSGTLVTLSASSDSTITYSEVGSNLTTGNMTLSGANITTTDFGGASTTPTQYSFTIRATDAEGQYLDRAFTINSTFGATGGGQFN